LTFFELCWHTRRAIDLYTFASIWVVLCVGALVAAGFAVWGLLRLIVFYLEHCPCL
jgi:hypothetical protein